MTPQALAEACAEAMWAEDRASAGLGMRIVRVAPGECEMTMRVEERMVNGHGICHGGFIFALADSAFAFSCNSRNRATVAAGADIEYLAPCREGDVLIAEGEVEQHQRRPALGGHALGRRTAIGHGQSGAVVDLDPAAGR